MPESRNRPGHHYQQKADIPAKQRVKGRVIWAILFAVFGLMIAYFSAGEKLLVLVLVPVIAAIIGYVVGKNMEEDVKKKA